MMTIDANGGPLIVRTRRELEAMLHGGSDSKMTAASQAGVTENSQLKYNANGHNSHKIILMDVRTRDECRAGVIPGAVNIPGGCC